MIDDRELQALIDYAGPGPVVSVYLDTDTRRLTKDAVKLMVREAARGVSVEEEIAAVLRFLDYEYDWQSRGLALFVSGRVVWQAIPLPVGVRTQVTLSARPSVRTLIDLRDRYSKYVVALCDRESLRLFCIDWGSVRAEAAHTGEELKRHRQGGFSAARYQRREDNLAVQNLRQAVEATIAFMEEMGTHRLMLAGSNETVAQLRDLLPAAVAAGLMGHFVADIQATSKEILTRSLDIAYEADLAAERRLVHEAITAAAKGGLGVTGLADTLYVLHQGRARTLLVDEDLRAEGYVCVSCGYLAAKQQDTCSLCRQGPVVPTEDIVNLAIAKADDVGSAVNIVRTNDELKQVGGIAAILRY